MSMTIKEAREYAHMTRKEVEDEFNIPARSLQNWEMDIRQAPDYVEEWLVDKLVHHVRFAQIRWEDAFIIHEGDEPQKGYSCYLNDVNDPDGAMKFSWFFPLDDKNKIDVGIIDRIAQLNENDWKVFFI